jgi:hypothetical protein
MMKKLFTIILIVVVAAVFTFGTVAASTNFTIIKGMVTEIEDDLVTVETKQGEIYQVHVPGDFDPKTLVIDDAVMAKAQPLEDGTWQATSFHILDEDEDDVEEEEEDEEEDSNGTKLNSAFCDPDKQGRPHPLAVTIAARFEVEESWVMEHYCTGDSMGAIMLALKTSSFEGVDADADTILELRKSGAGWGQIWKELKLIGNERIKEDKVKEKNTPPGQLKKEEKDN